MLIGDSMSDIQGGRAAGTRVIAYANRPPKVEAFRTAGADLVVTSMGPIAETRWVACSDVAGYQQRAAGTAV